MGEEGRSQVIVMMDQGYCGGGRTMGTIPEGTDQLLYKNEL